MHMRGSGHGTAISVCFLPWPLPSLCMRIAELLPSFVNYKLVKDHRYCGRDLSL